MKKISPIIILLLVVISGFSFWSAAQAACVNPDHTCNNSACPAGCTGEDDPDCYSNGCCDDGKVQTPNGLGQYEKCDSADTETASCTANCGQKLLGWGWADTYGWLSLNFNNCQGLPVEICQAQTIPVYVQATADDTILGWAWTDNLGWVCFGQTCYPDAAHICNNLPGCNPVSFGTNPPPGVTGSDWNIRLTEDGSGNLPAKGWAKALVLGDNGWISLSCLNDNSCNKIGVSGKPIDYQVWLTQKNFSAESKFGLSGWSWNDLLGWTTFDVATSVKPWLQTQYSDIYARKFSAEKPPPGYNSTYQILSGGDVINFISSKTGNQWISRNFGPINFPTPETRYSNVLGKLDTDGLLCAFGADNTCLNQYGKIVVKIKDANDFITLAKQPLGGKIYYYDGDLTIDRPDPEKVTFFNGDRNSFASGAGTIIVNGILTVNSNLFYDDSNNLSKFRNLASVAWIVKGDLRIGPKVTNLAGNFIVIGNSAVGPCDPNPDTEKLKCGQIYSCYNSSDCTDQLSVSGLMMARKFYLKRTFENQIQGSELIIYDGRLLANTPPGLADFAKALPIYRSGVFAN